MIQLLSGSLATKLERLLFWFVVLATAAGAFILLWKGNRFEGWVGVASLLIFITVQIVLPRAAGMSNPAGMRIMISLLMLISLTIGRYFSLYKKIEHYDKLQHLLYGVIISLIAIVVLYRLIPAQMRTRSVLHPPAIGIFSVGTTMIVLFIWELFEYICDRLFNSDMQDWQTGGISGLTDTMVDLAVGFTGSVITSVIIVIVYKRNKTIFYERFLKGFFPVVLATNLVTENSREEAVKQ